MKACTFFGHRDTNKKIEPALVSALVDLIENKNVDTFYVGNHGNFDDMVKKVLGELKNKYSHINYFIVCSRLVPKKDDEFFNFIYPLCAIGYIPKRNEWMIKRSDYVITYVRTGYGGAARFKRYSKRAGKIVIDL